MFKYLAGKTGGLGYHFTALKRSSRDWKEFRDQVRLWLLAWQKTWNDEIDELIIFGPSAGWTLPLSEFPKNKRIIFVEPDPTARLLLKMRLKHPDTHFITDSKILPWIEGETSKFRALLQAHPHASVLFSNLLGQVELLKQTSEPFDHFSRRQLQTSFIECLAGRPWASYHDLYSTTTSSESSLAVSNLPAMPASMAAKRLEEIAGKTFTDAREMTDHETQWLSENRETKFAVWPLAKKQIHLIGFVTGS